MLPKGITVFAFDFAVSTKWSALAVSIRNDSQSLLCVSRWAGCRPGRTVPMPLASLVTEIQGITHALGVRGCRALGCRRAAM
jgi:hypothetical protein